MFRKIKRYLNDPVFAFGCDMIKKCPDLLPDRFFLETQGRISMGYKLNLDNPQTFCEKIAWMKLNCRNDLYTILVDKHLVKVWLREQYGEDHIIPTLAVYNESKEINFDMLPDAFVLKCNHDSGSVYICHDKEKGVYFDKYMQSYSKNEVKQLLDNGLKRNFYLEHREWPYKNVKPCIIAEPLLIQENGMIPNDYKLFYINGEFQFTYVSFDREGINDRCTYDANWQKLPFVYVDHYNKDMNTSVVPCPKSYQTMIDYGKKIAQNFKFVRIDMYDIDGKMFFGEVTPYHSAGYARFYPQEYDAVYADKLKLNEKL